MMGGLAALILLSTMSLIQTAEVPQLMSFTAVEVGGNVTLPCPLSETQDKVFHWYKQALGYMVQTVVTRAYEKSTFSEQFMSSRFDITEDKSQSLLTIRNVTKEDEATYFCQSGAAYSPRFVTGIFLAVKDRNQQKHVYVQQSPETASVQLGASMTLQCSLLSTNKGNRVQCPGEHSVHWFRAGSGGFHPGIVFNHSSRREEQEERSCVYSLSKTIHNSSDAGTYYCAVVTCGQILFGEGTNVETKLDLVDIVLGGLLACCVTVIAVLIYYLNRRKACEHCKGSSHNPGHDKLTVDQSTDPDGDADAANYVALNFSTRREKRAKKRRESPQECVYSAVKVNYHTSH
ncbi:immunoglobulin kappa light chain-like isoform X1 [Trachinotus anak]|uniref:immunoglobulin kappa light chain-like isoform X1 n=1 Tax=Trachinotus anak TaxID=443729 RepID=UPI0039F16FEF